MTSTQTQARKINWRSVALPAEHGGWSLILEPMIAGLILAPSWIVLGLSIAIMLAFLLHQPLKITLKAYRSKKWTERSRFALNLTMTYMLVATIFALPALLQSNRDFWLVAALIIPFALIQIFYDYRSESRSAVAEITGAIALSGTSALLLVLSDWQLHTALLLSFVIALRAVTAILYVRTFFRKQRGRETSIAGNYLIHLIALIVVMLIAFAGYLPHLTIVPFVILLLRAVHGLGSEETVKAQTIGFREVFVGVITILCIVGGFIFKI